MKTVIVKDLGLLVLVLDGLLGSTRELTRQAGALIRAQRTAPRLAQLEPALGIGQASGRRVPSSARSRFVR